MKFVFTCDDVGAAPGPKPVKWFESVVEWLDRKHIPGTFFWIPKSGNKPSDRNTLWMDAIRRARRVGHDFQLHGLTHHCLEFGVPQKSIRRHAPKMFEEYERDRRKWQGEHTVESLEKKFAEAIAIYERAFAEKPLVFRAPCLGICANAYRAMFRSGIRYSSSRSVNPAATGYVITRKPELKAWQPDYNGRPFKEPPGVLEVPTLEDLAIRGVKPGEFDFVLNLFKREIKNYVKGLGDWPFGVFLSHYQTIGKQPDVMTKLYDEMFHWMAAEGIAEWVTFKSALS